MKTVVEGLRQKAIQRAILIAVGLLGIFFAIGAALFVLIPPDGLKNWVGNISCILGLAFLLGGIDDITWGAQRLSQLFNTQSGIQKLEKICATHRLGRNLSLINLPLCASLVWGYINLPILQHFSLWDLGGLIFFMATWTLWTFLHDIALQRAKTMIYRTIQT